MLPPLVILGTVGPLEILELLEEPPLLDPLPLEALAAPPLPVVPPVLPPRDELPVDVEPPVVAVPPAGVPPLLAEALGLEPPWEEEPPISMVLPMALPGSLLPPLADELELDLELLAPPPPLLPPLGPLDADEEFELSPLLCEGGARAQPIRPLARRARIGGERNFMHVLLRL